MASLTPFERLLIATNSTLELQKQKITSHVLDPDGDTILVLSTKDAIVSGPNVVDLVIAEKWNLEVDKRVSNAGSVAPMNNGPTSSGAVNGGQASTKYTCGKDDTEVHVSSRHLSLVSPVFKAMLSRNYREGQDLQKNGSVKIALEDDPVGGILVPLKILHCSFEVQNMTSLLMQVALMADKYNVAARILYWSQVWCIQIKNHVPTVWSSDVVLYLGMFDMLKVEDQKQAMMNLA